jgi:ABC-type glutathione transport system ATPase component
MFGISHTVNTKIGDDFVRGVSGGERKRVTIAEAVLSYAPLQCWDNSTRGLDSANAIEFCKTLRTQCDVFRASTCVAIYQAPQAAYNVSYFPFHHIRPALTMNSSLTKSLFCMKVGRYTLVQLTKLAPTSKILVSSVRHLKLTPTFSLL